MDRQEVVELAKEYAAKGFLCSESVLLAISNWLRVHSELIPKIATGFGAGVGAKGKLCGAVSGAIMALGLRFGRSKVKIEQKKVYWFAYDFLQHFEREHSYTTCRELTGCDFDIEEDRKRYDDEKMWEKRCRKYIGTATGITFDLINEKT